MLGWSYVFHGALSAGPGRQHPGVPRLRQRLRWRVVPAACLQAIAVDRSVAVSPDQAIERERVCVYVRMIVYVYVVCSYMCLYSCIRRCLLSSTKKDI